MKGEQRHRNILVSSTYSVKRQNEERCLHLGTAVHSLREF